jgi:hypothetical protein
MNSGDHDDACARSAVWDAPGAVTRVYALEYATDELVAPPKAEMVDSLAPLLALAAEV